ncbi:MAG: gamma-glutamyltransferase family protein [Anaerolineales bacterium]|nr:gamma-glutamyltransferase family protein [Anaerolineales bacterium]
MTDLMFASRRSPVLARRGMVAASQPLAAQAGLEALRLGGTAADAAVATAAALNVTEPVSTGIGGDCFGLYYEAATGAVTALNGSGRAPGGLTLEAARRAADGAGALPVRHAHTVTVPGACAGWCDLAARHGRLPLAVSLGPAIELAEAGFPVAPLTAFYWQRGAEQVLRSAPGGSALTVGGRGPRAGEVFRNPGLGRTLRAVAEGGAEAFYRGAIAEAIAARVQAAGGVLSVEDLAAHVSTWEVAISTVYRGLRVWECPPNGQGLTALLALNVLAGFEVGGRGPLSVERWHLLIEALRIAFADARWYVADPRAVAVPTAGLLAEEYAVERRRWFDPRRASLDVRRGAPLGGGGTVYLCAVDGEGNACSFINSNYMGFGTGMVPGEGEANWGFSLQNRGHNFSLEAGHPNVLAPGKRPYHTIIPGLLTHAADGSLYGPFGVMGAFMQPQGHVQVVVGLADDGLEPQAALDRLRFCIEDGTAGGAVAMEAGLPAELAAGLRALGHPLRGEVSGWARAMFGRGQIIRRGADGVLWGGSDPRADGAVAGW